MPATLLTWNPAVWRFEEGEWARDLDSIEHLGAATGRWSVGRVKNIPVGRRVFLLRQGTGPRGIVGSGYTTSEPLPDVHHSQSGALLNYVDVEWDALVIDPDDPLPTEDLLELVPEVPWNNILGSGTSVRDEEAVRTIEGLWADRLGVPPNPGPTPGGQGHLSDAELRKAIEDHAQGLLTARFEADGWDVEDTRVGNPYDAVATRDGRVAYLEAKGTVGSGENVFVTAGEVAWAREHPGACFIGVVAHVEVKDGAVVDGSGELTVLPWKPHEADLQPVQYRWTTGIQAPRVSR
ncbi:protein NO VEIN domain-containing protein [Puerhibacterium sp. TATVAM-FAB25]|uniref:protein NO VEIN domain-containing protein n=1 Tax=Puerhibacterium sp. TATVAM-FAB25 TaxID=3093699 RepID=UPI00397B2787